MLDSKEHIEILEPEVDQLIDLIVQYSEAINNFERTIVVWGWVQYRHMFSTDRTCYADFCYSYVVSERQLTQVGRHTKQREEKDDPGEK